MSTTATETRTLISLLGDYELHHSVASEETPGPSPMASPPPSSQPASWPTHHRRVPPYRPINYNLDLNDRPTGSNPVESVLIFLMMHGVWLNAVSDS